MLEPKRRLFRFHVDSTLGAKPQTVLWLVPDHFKMIWEGKAKQQHVGLIWEWNYCKISGSTNMANCASDSCQPK